MRISISFGNKGIFFSMVQVLSVIIFLVWSLISVYGLYSLFDPDITAANVFTLAGSWLAGLSTFALACFAYRAFGDWKKQLAVKHEHEALIKIRNELRCLHRNVSNCHDNITDNRDYLSKPTQYRDMTHAFLKEHARLLKIVSYSNVAQNELIRDYLHICLDPVRRNTLDNYLKCSDVTLNQLESFTRHTKEIVDRPSTEKMKKYLVELDKFLVTGDVEIRGYSIPGISFIYSFKNHKLYEEIEDMTSVMELQTINVLSKKL